MRAQSFIGGCFAVAAVAGSVSGADFDNNVEWDGLSHIGFFDRSPRVPMGGEAFVVRFQTYRGDVTSARVVLGDGGSAGASVVGSRGPYDLWEAAVPATAASTRSYVIEVTDGLDTDYLGASGPGDTSAVGSWVLDFVTLEHAPVGATLVDGPSGSGAVFKVWSPSRARAFVRGEFNNWSTSDELTRVGEHFVGFVPGVEARDMYKFYFADANGTGNAVWNTDPRAATLVPTDNYNARVWDTEGYEWQSGAFAPARFENMVVYQLHVGSFAGLNDPMGFAPNPSRFRDVGDRADHLAELGVNVVMFNPFMEFPGDFSGGYNPINQYSPESKYGTPDDLKYMIDELHERGIAVLLDIVWNHTTISDNLLWNYDGTQIYFDTPNVDTPWGAQNDFGRQGVREWYLDSVVHWLDEYRMDGFRMDATSFMDIQDGGWSLMQEMNNLMDRRYADKIAIAEQLPDNPWVTRPTSLGGAGFDSQYYDRFTDDLRDEIFNAAFRSVNIPRLRDITYGGGQYLDDTRVTNYFELHDEAWGLSGGQRAVKTIDTTSPHNDEFARGRTTLAQSFTMLTPGIPAMLMGTEWLESNEFETQRLDWAKKSANAGVLRMYQDLIPLRTSSPALRSDAPHLVFHENDAMDIMAWQRVDLFGTGQAFVVAANFSDTDRGIYRIGVPEAGRWEVVLNTQAAEYGGHGFGSSGSVFSDGEPRDGYAQSIELEIPRMGLIVLELNGPRACVADVNGDGMLSGADFNGWLTAFVAGDDAADQNGDGMLSGADFNAFLTNYLAGCD